MLTLGTHSVFVTVLLLHSEPSAEPHVNMIQWLRELQVVQYSQGHAGGGLGDGSAPRGICPDED